MIRAIVFLNELIYKVVLSKIEHFFKHYKDNEPDKWVRVMGFKDKEFALQLIRKQYILQTLIKTNGKPAFQRLWEPYN